MSAAHRPAGTSSVHTMGSPSTTISRSAYEMTGSAPSTMFPEAKLFEHLVPTEGVGWDHDGGGTSTFLPPHVFSIVRSPEAIVTSQLAGMPAGTPVASVAGRLAPYTKRAKERELHEAAIKPHETSKIDRLLHKLDIHHRPSPIANEGVEPALPPAFERDGLTHYAHEGRSGNDGWQGQIMLPLTNDGLYEIGRCGDWRGARPSDLFLNVFGQALLALDEDPLRGVCSPALLGSTGVVPLTIISVIPDIIHHHADLIVRARHEIILATHIWEASGAAKVLTDALRELSRRVVTDGRPPVVVKIMFNGRNARQLVSPHQGVSVAEYTGPNIRLPRPEEVPGLNLQVQDYHVPPVGTFHAKYMIVDRGVAVVCSNNIQDRANLEMMVQYEGPIVQSLYDMALVTWSTPLIPEPPLLRVPPLYPDPGAASQYTFGSTVSGRRNLPAVGIRALRTLVGHHEAALIRGDDLTPQANRTNWDRTYDLDDASEAEHVNTPLVVPDVLNQHLNTGRPIAGTDISTIPTAPFRPIVLMPPHDPVPMALVNRPPRGTPGHGSTIDPQAQAWVAAFKFARNNVFIQTPTFTAKPAVAAALEAVKRGVLVEIYVALGSDDESKLQPFQGATNEMVAQHMYAALDDDNKDRLRIYWYTGKDQRVPLNASHKSRNAHITVMIVDNQIAMQGSGNHDTQSWFHSQEVNVLIDSPEICRTWRAALERNQNTLLHGRVQNDGVWRDKYGQLLVGAKAAPGGIARPFVVV